VEEERFALSNEDLYTKNIPSDSAISLSAPAVFIAIASDSITHGPAIKKKGESDETE
jgi:hypothetical protein